MHVTFAIYYNIPFRWPKIKNANKTPPPKQTILSVGEDVEKLELSYTSDINVK